MITWENINNKEFENLAFEYMVSNYPNLRWEKTKMTNDGNKDGESVISYLPFNTTIKYWYEAKYSVNTNKSIPKSHLDSTLVSSLLDGHVVVIAFITNAYISDDYKRRADIFASNRDNLKIYYINGEEIESWLSDNPTIEDKYFHTNCAQKYYIEDKIETVCFLDKYDCGDNRFLKLSTIKLRNEYLIYVRFKSSKDQNVGIVLDDAFESTSCYMNIYKELSDWNVKKGDNSLFLPVKVIISKPEYVIKIKICSEVKNYIIKDIKTLDLYTPQLFISSQMAILNDINLFINSNTSNNLFFLIVGNAGSGKTYLLNQIRNNVTQPFSSILLNFSGNEEKDFLLCYKLFIFCQFGNIWELKIEDLQYLNLDLTIKEVLNEINNGISSPITYNKIVDYCNRNLTETKEANFLQQNIYIDDIQKASKSVLELFQSIMAWVYGQRMRKRFFLFSRPILSKNEKLNDFLKLNACYYKEVQQPSISDVEYSIKSNIGNYPAVVSLIKSTNVDVSALYLYDLLCRLKEKIIQINCQDIIETSLKISQIMDDLISVQSNFIRHDLFVNYYSNIIFDFVYTLESGVDIKALVDFFGEKIYEDIFILCQKNVIKEISGKLYPFHDTLLEEFKFEKKNIYKEKIGEFILFCQNKGHLTDSECYYQLVSLGGKYFWKYRAICAKFRDELHGNANYYEAEKIAKTIQKENHKNLRDYDYSDIKNMFILGNCYKYTTSYESANNIFDKIIEIYQLSTSSIPNDILLETISEKINNNIWMLNVNNADKELKRMFELWNFNNIQNNTKSYKYGYLNYYNRRMFCNFMQGRGTEDDYKMALLKSNELGLIEYEGFAHMDYAKSIYNIDMYRAFGLLNMAKDIFEKSNEPRRLLDSLSEIAFTKALLEKDYSIIMLQNIGDKMKEQKYIHSYTRNCLKIIVIMLLSQKYTQTELLNLMNKMLMKNTAIASGKRHQAIAYHVLAAIYYFYNDIIQANKYSEKCLQLFSELGEDYKKIQFHNAEIKRKGKIILACENPLIDSDNFILDTRIW